MPWWFRAFLLVNVVEDFAVGLTGLFDPDAILVPLEDVTPLNARFIAALYIAGGTAIGIAALLARAQDTRPVLAAFGVITVLVAAVTYANWDEFTAGGTPVVWLVTYTLDPVLIVAIAFVLGLWKPERTERHRLTPLLLAIAFALGAIGVALFLVPGTMVDLWPWGMTELLARLYATFFVAFAAGAIVAAWEPRPPALLPVFAGLTVLPVVTLVASALHTSRFDGGPSTWIWVGAAVAMAVASAAALAATARSRVRTT